MAKFQTQTNRTSIPVKILTCAPPPPGRTAVCIGDQLLNFLYRNSFGANQRLALTLKSSLIVQVSLWANLQTMCKTNIRIWDCFYHNCFRNCDHKNRVQNSFITLALRLPKYVSARLLHEAWGLPYVRERLITVGHNT